MHVCIVVGIWWGAVVHRVEYEMVNEWGVAVRRRRGWRHFCGTNKCAHAMKEGLPTIEGSEAAGFQW